jgi:hypothetical protein
MNYDSSFKNFESHENTIKTMLNSEYKETTNEYDYSLEFLKTNMENGSFIHHPFTCSKNPDFLVKTNAGQVFKIEAKTSCDNRPSYGNTPPDDCIYIFTSLKADMTAIYCGEDIFTSEHRRVWDEARETCNQLRDRINSSNSLLSFTFRPSMRYKNSVKHFDSDVRSSLYKKAIERITHE